MAVALLDANFILRYCLGDIPDQSAVASEFMERVKAGEVAVAVPDYVLAECIFVLGKSYGMPRSDIATWFRGFLGTAGMNMAEKSITMEALAVYERSNLSIVDSLLAARIKNEGGELISFDKQLLKFIRNFSVTG